MSSAAAIAFPSLVEAISFLTCPLSLVVPEHTVKSLQLILLSNLSTTPAWLRNGRLTLTFSPAAPPRAVFAACVATQIYWVNWFYLIGGREFDLIVERHTVSVQFTGIPGRAVIWKQVPATRPTFVLPVASLGSIDKSNQRLTETYPIIPITHAHSPPSQTFAQQLLQSEHEKEEADEIFAMISNLDASAISPSFSYGRLGSPKAPVPRAPAPTRSRGLSALTEEDVHSRFSFSQPDLSRGLLDTSLDSLSESSRSSSPSSSLFSSQESLTSISSTSSLNFSSPSSAAAKLFAPTNKRTPTFRLRGPVTPPVVDSSKAHVQRYLYHGGQSTTLTGGVMLGAGSKAPTILSSGTKNSTTRNKPSHPH